MKFKYILSTILAVAALAACEKEQIINTLPGVEISSSYVSFTKDGGSQSITVKANTDWTIDTTGTSTWLKVDPLLGSANAETKVTLTAAANAAGAKEVSVTLNLTNGKTQLITVGQGGSAAAPATVKDVIEGVDGTTYNVTATVKSITNKHYGNIYLNDGTSETDLYLYGVLDKKGNEMKSSSTYDVLDPSTSADAWDISVGDVITVEGARKTYSGTIEFENATIKSVVKSLLDVAPLDLEVGKEGCDTTVVVKYKGQGLDVEPQVEWIALTGIKVGTDSTIVSLHVDANTDNTRVGTVLVKSSIPGQSSEKTITFTQASGLDCYPLPYEEKFDLNMGAWTISDVKGLASGNVWSFDAENKCMKASGYVGGANNETESDLISPRIDLTGETVASLTFEHAAKYGKSLDDEFTLWISKDNGETYTQILVPVYTEKKNWNYVSNTVSLTPYVGSQVLVKFKYKSYLTGGPTVDLRNVSIKAEEVVITNIAQLNSTAVSTKVNFTATLTDAVVSYVNGSNAFIQDATAGIQLYKSGHGLTAGQKISGTVTGEVSLYSGFAELTSIDITSATVTAGDAPEPKVITVADLNKTYLRNQNCLLKVENATFEAAAAGTGKVSGKMIQGEDSIVTRTQVKTVAYEAAPKAYDVVCIPTLYNSAIQVGIWENPVARPE